MTDEERLALKDKVEEVIKKLEPVITEDKKVQARELADNCELCDVLTYLKDNVPEVNEYLSGLPVDATDEEKLAAINAGMKKRAESLVPAYDMSPPFLGNEVEEARDKQENNMYRYKSQYGQVPMVNPVYRGRSAVDNPYYTNPNKALKKVGRNPVKHTRISFL